MKLGDRQDLQTNLMDTGKDRVDWSCSDGTSARPAHGLDFTFTESQFISGSDISAEAVPEY